MTGSNDPHDGAPSAQYAAARELPDTTLLTIGAAQQASRSADWQVRRSLATILAFDASAAGSGLLGGLLLDAEDLVRVAALEALVARVDCGHREALAARMVSDRSVLVRSYAGWALLEIHGAEAVGQVLAATMDEPDQQARTMLWLALYPWTPDEALEPMLRALYSRSPLLRAICGNQWPAPVCAVHAQRMVAALERALEAEGTDAAIGLAGACARLGAWRAVAGVLGGDAPSVIRRAVARADAVIEVQTHVYAAAADLPAANRQRARRALTRWAKPEEPPDAGIDR